MKTVIYILLTLLPAITSYGQAISLFQVVDTLLSDKERNRIEKLRKLRKTFYEDDEYLVSKTCSGEWGGTVKFKNKKTGIEYSCSATCPVAVNKINGEYFVTNSLAHLSGSTEILKITRPDSMDIFRMPPPRKKKRNKIFRYVGDNESKSTKGTKVLLDSVGVLTLGSFEFEGTLFQVVTDFKKTYIAKIENKKFIMVEFICEGRTWTYDNDMIKTDDGHTIITIQGGYLEIFDNKVRLLRSS